MELLQKDFEVCVCVCVCVFTVREYLYLYGVGKWGQVLSKAPTDSGRKVRKKKEDGVTPFSIYSFTLSPQFLDFLSSK